MDSKSNWHVNVITVRVFTRSLRIKKDFWKPTMFINTSATLHLCKAFLAEVYFFVRLSLISGRRNRQKILWFWHSAGEEGFFYSLYYFIVEIGLGKNSRGPANFIWSLKADISSSSQPILFVSPALSVVIGIFVKWKILLTRLKIHRRSKKDVKWNLFDSCVNSTAFKLWRTKNRKNVVHWSRRAVGTWMQNTCFFFHLSRSS